MKIKVNKSGLKYVLFVLILTSSNIANSEPTQTITLEEIKRADADFEKVTKSQLLSWNESYSLNSEMGVMIQPHNIGVGDVIIRFQYTYKYPLKLEADIQSKGLWGKTKTIIQKGALGYKLVGASLGSKQNAVANLGDTYCFLPNNADPDNKGACVIVSSEQKGLIGAKPFYFGRGGIKEEFSLLTTLVFSEIAENANSNYTVEYRVKRIDSNDCVIEVLINGIWVEDLVRSTTLKSENFVPTEYGYFRISKDTEKGKLKLELTSLVGS